MDRSVAWRAALLQALLLTVTALVLAALLDRQFFEDWGWLAGPAAWAGWALAVGAVLRLPPLRPLAGAALGPRPARPPRRRRAGRPPEPDPRAHRRPLARRAVRRGAVRRLVRPPRHASPLAGLMALGVRDRVALVTAGSKGIGRAIAEGLAAEGARVALTSRSADTADEVAARIGGARGYAFDSDDLDAVPALLDRVQADLGPIDIYIANTGGPPAGDPLSFTRAQWEAAHRTLILSPMAVLQRILPGMRERGFGRVVAIGSLAVLEPLDPLQLSNAHRPGLVAGVKGLPRQGSA